jgi:molybdopterin/thiamine biosynthesis adenylyltransferase
MKPSNSTRMYADGLRHYGRHKLIPLAESIYEYNPFATVKLYKEGLNNQNVHDFFFDDKDRPLDIIIDAADDGLTKILIRKICKEYKIPMIAGFDEKGAIIIYRYDKPEILIEDDPSLNEETLKGIQERSQKDYIFKLLDFFPGGADNITSRQKKTIQGVLNKDLGGFSQLAWEASLFSAYISKATLDIALDKDITGAKLFDLDLEITDEMRVTSQKKAI